MTTHRQLDPPALLARGEVHRLLAQTFLPPDETGDVARSDELLHLEDLIAGWLCDRPARPLLSSALRLRELDRTRSLADRQTEHARVLGHTVPKDCPPYETHYGGELGGEGQVFMQAQELADIAAFYHAFGMEVKAGTERVDHIAVELEFVAFLCFKLAHARQAIDESEPQQVVGTALERFFTDHIGRWGPAFCRLLRRQVGDGFYAALAELTLAVLEQDRIEHNLPEWPGEQGLRSFAVEEPDCAGCPVAAG